MTPANLSGVKDAYYMARRYEDTIDAVLRMPEEQRTRDSWVFLTASYARLGRTEEAAGAKAKLLKAFPNVSAERMINEDYVYARKEDEDFFVDGFRVAGLPVCMTADEIAQFPAAKPRPDARPSAGQGGRREILSGVLDPAQGNADLLRGAQRQQLVEGARLQQRGC